MNVFVLFAKSCPAWMYVWRTRISWLSILFFFFDLIASELVLLIKKQNLISQVPCCEFSHCFFVLFCFFSKWPVSLYCHCKLLHNSPTGHLGWPLLMATLCGSQLGCLQFLSNWVWKPLSEVMYKYCKELMYCISLN